MQHSFWNHMEFLWNFRHYFGEYPLQNDGHNWLRRMHNSFISDKKWNISFRERAGLKNIYNKKRRLNLSNRNTTCVNKIIFYFDGTKIIFDARFDINSAYQNSGCKLKKQATYGAGLLPIFWEKNAIFQKECCILSRIPPWFVGVWLVEKDYIWFSQRNIAKEWHMLLCNQGRLHCCI